MANSVHYPSLAEFEDVKIAAICDLDEERLHTTADKYEVERRYKDYKRMIEEVDPDAVYIIMPPHHLSEEQLNGLRDRIAMPGRSILELPLGVGQVAYIFT